MACWRIPVDLHNLSLFVLNQNHVIPLLKILKNLFAGCKQKNVFYRKGWTYLPKNNTPYCNYLPLHNPLLNQPVALNGPSPTLPHSLRSEGGGAVAPSTTGLPPPLRGRVGVGGENHDYFGSFAFTALTSSTLISPTVVTSPFWIRHLRNGPVMSPFGSNDTAPITPT